MISSHLGPHAAARIASKISASVFAYTLIVNLQATLPAASFQHPPGPDGAYWPQKLLHFRSRVDKVAARAALDCTIAHIIDHNSDLERAKQKVERSGPAPIVVELEQTINTVA